MSSHWGLRLFWDGKVLWHLENQNKDSTLCQTPGHRKNAYSKCECHGKILWKIKLYKIPASYDCNYAHLSLLGDCFVTDNFCSIICFLLAILYSCFEGDVRIQSQQDKLHQYILNNLQPADRKILQSMYAALSCYCDNVLYSQSPYGETSSNVM